MIRTTTPETFSFGKPAISGERPAWARHGEDTIIPTGDSMLSEGQAWHYNEDGDLTPTGEPITNDSIWHYNEGGDLTTID